MRIIRAGGMPIGKVSVFSLLRGKVALFAFLLALPVLADVPSPTPVALPQTTHIETTDTAPVAPRHVTFATTPSPAPPVPATVKFSLSNLNYYQSATQADGTTSCLMRGNNLLPGFLPILSYWSQGVSLIPLGTHHLQLGIFPFEAGSVITADGRNSVEVRWLPTSLYFFPVMLRGHFVKTGAVVTTSSENTTGAAISPTMNQTTTVKVSVEQTFPNARTRYSYDKAAIYGVTTADLTHLFDFRADPLRTEHPRAGIGILWAGHPDIPNGVDFDKAHNSVSVRTDALEVTRSIDSGPATWYVSYIYSYQE